MTSLKMDGFMRPFRGRGDDWDMFWTKYGVLASASGWNTTAKKMDRLPLFLEGEAFLVFSKMSELDKRDADRVTFVMRKSFSVTASEAYRMFTLRKLLMDESRMGTLRTCSDSWNCRDTSRLTVILTQC